MKCWCLLFMTKERGNDLFGRFPPAKPLWSEVIIFLDVLLRQTTPSQELARRNRSPHQFNQSVSNRGGLFSFPTLHLLTTVIYCLSKGRGIRFRMKIIIQHNSMVPIYEQLVNQIKSLILEESLRENEPLPSVRVLAKEIKASALTVKKAYDLLEQEGFIATIHGKGSFVLAVNKHAKRENLLYSTQEELEQVIKKARQAGISKAELAELIAMILEEELG